MATSHSKKAAAFLSNPDKVTRHDQTFWGIREKRDIQAAMLPEWDDLREVCKELGKQWRHCSLGKRCART